MTIEKTSQIKAGDNLVMVVYGKGGVGKTSFTASAPKVLLLDFENGSKYLGDRGIDADVIRFQGWLTEDDKRQLASIIAPYHTIALDPLGEAMDKLLDCSALNGKKFRQADGSLTMAGWGEAKKQMRNFIKYLRDSGKNVIIVAHVSEEKDGDQITNRIQVATKLREEIPNIVDIISYMGVKMVDGNPVRVLYTPRQGDGFDSKDRTGRVPLTVKVGEKTGFQDLLTAMGIKSQEIPETAPVPVHDDPPEDPRQPPTQPPYPQPPAQPREMTVDDQLRKSLLHQLDGSIVAGLITKADRDDVMAKAQKGSGKVLSDFVEKVSAALYEKYDQVNKNIPPEVKPEVNPEVRPEEIVERYVEDPAQQEIW